MGAAGHLLAWLAVGLAVLLPRTPALRLPGRRRVLFTGDSTIRYQFEALCSGAKRSIRGTHSFRECMAAEGADLLYLDYLKSPHRAVRAGPDGAAGYFEQVYGLVPEVVYMNTYGIWSLHLEPARKWGGWADFRANYAAHLLANLRRLHARGVQSVIFMSTHHVCEGNFYGSWRSAVTNSSGMGLKEGCDAYLASNCPGMVHHPCDADQRLLCGTSTLTHLGSTRISEEEAATVAACRAAGMPLGLVNGHAISAAAGCSHSRDGRHYDASVLHAELAALDEELRRLGAEPFVSSLRIRGAGSGRGDGRATDTVSEDAGLASSTGAADSSSEAVRAATKRS